MAFLCFECNRPLRAAPTAKSAERDYNGTVVLMHHACAERYDARSKPFQAARDPRLANAGRAQHGALRRRQLRMRQRLLRC